MNVNELRSKYIEFFKSKNHAVISGQSLIPENDPSVLFTTAGMHPLVPYLLGEKHPAGTRLTDYQKCVRTGDIDEVGDPSHLTCFEMLGNWSLGDYFKKESIAFSYEFLTSPKWLALDPRKLSVTVFEGDEDAPRDEEAASYWKENGMPEDKIAYLPKSDNWWAAGPTGPCGPDTEIFYWVGEGLPPVGSNKGTDSANWMEIWNNVFMQYNRIDEKTLVPLPKKNVDTGMGLERIASVLEGVTDNYKSTIWKDVIAKIEEITGLPYEGNEKAMRIIADHIRSSVFMSADPAGIKPSNTDQGYILRRLIRRAIRYAKKLNIDIDSNWEEQIAVLIIEKYKGYYPELEENRQVVLDVLKGEKVKFNRTLEKGLKEFEKIASKITDGKMDKDNAFRLYDTFGFPIELTVELANEMGIKVDEEGFKEKFKAHQELSRAGAKEKFKGGLAATGETETQYHTATHLLNAALKVVVSPDCHQKGSNITAERMRFDFSCDHKLTDEEKQQTEDLVNKWIDEGLVVTKEEMSKEEAINSGAECMFIERYPDVVTVYKIGQVSAELCGGPHVSNTKEIPHIKIKKEEACSAGIRRIKAEFVK